MILASLLLGANVHIDAPQGGIFAWLRLPAGLSCLDLMATAGETGMGFAPGTRFFPMPAEGEANLRLNFATQAPEAIEEGIKRLARAMELCQA